MLLLHLLGVAAVTGATLLGVWQLDAWQAHRADRAADLADAEPVALDGVLAPDDPFPADAAGRPVRVSGRWLPEETVSVERGLDGRSGYWVVTPVATCAGADCPAVLVVRGWSAAHPAPPPAPLPAQDGTVEVTGWLQPGESAPDGSEGATDGADRAADGDVLSALRVVDVLERMDRDLYGGYVIARSPADPALEPVTPDSLPDPPAFTAVRNLLYALEWWVFALFAGFLWLRWCRDELTVTGAAATPEQPQDARETASGSPVPSAP
jgi:cytochrome oxidase assembly protein ShyY1